MQSWSLASCHICLGALLSCWRARQREGRHRASEWAFENEAREQLSRAVAAASAAVVEMSLVNELTTQLGLRVGPRMGRKGPWRPCVPPWRSIVVKTLRRHQPEDEEEDASGDAPHLLNILLPHHIQDDDNSMEEF